MLHLEKPKDAGDVAMAYDGYDSANAPVIGDVESSKEWILDLGCSFHIYPNKRWL